MRHGITPMTSAAADLDSSGESALLTHQRVHLEALEPVQRLQWAKQHFGAGFAMTTSFGIQSSVLLHMLSSLPDAEAVPVIWVDTGYLPPDTYQYADKLCELFHLQPVVVQSPMSPARMEALHGRLPEGPALALEHILRVRDHVHVTTNARRNLVLGNAIHFATT